MPISRIGSRTRGWYERSDATAYNSERVRFACGCRVLIAREESRKAIAGETTATKFEGVGAYTRRSVSGCIAGRTHTLAVDRADGLSLAGSSIAFTIESFTLSTER
jgi:hypothetical protein